MSLRLRDAVNVRYSRSFFLMQLFNASARRHVIERKCNDVIDLAVTEMFSRDLIELWDQITDQ
jgi:hypothetical protein